MGMEFFEMIKRVGIFMICAQALIHFRPNDSYEKYLRMLISIIVLVLILTPILNVFGTENVSISFENYENLWEIDLEKVNSRLNKTNTEATGDIDVSLETEPAQERSEQESGAEESGGPIRVEPVEVER